MSLAKKAVFWSAAFDMADGQAVVTKRVAEQRLGFDWIWAVYRPGASGIASTCGAALKLWWAILFRRHRLVYLVCSRSVPGFLRDFPALLAALVGVRVVVHAHGSDLPDLLTNGLVGWLARRLYRRCEIIVPSSHLLSPLATLGCIRVHLVENFAQPNLGENPVPVSGQPFTILWNSNVIASKGIRELVEATRRVGETGFDLKLIILGRPIGDGEASADEMQAYLNDIEGLEWVERRGPVSPEESARAASSCDLVALPSRYPSECQPLALIQAMCSGRRIVAGDTPALRATLGAYPARFAIPKAGPIAEALFVAIRDPEPGPSDVAIARARFAPSRFDALLASILNASE